MKQIALDFYQFNHAVRTPLTGILGLAGLLEQESLTPQQSRRIHGILQAGREMLQFIEKLEQKKPSAANKGDTKQRHHTINQRQSILLVEDHPLIQHIHTVMLTRLGYDVDVAGNGKEALEKFHQKHVAVLLDIGLPDQSGIAVATRMRQLERNFPNRLVPIIAITAQADEEMQETCLQAGMNACLMKPISQDQLGNVLHHWLQSTVSCAETEEK